MSCIDDPDISIRLQALQLGSGMINSQNLASVVDRLMVQLREFPAEGDKNNVTLPKGNHAIEPAADHDNEDPEETLRPEKSSPTESTPLPDEYRVTIIRQILDMCSRNTYTNIVDFEWYIDVLMELAAVIPRGIQDNARVRYDYNSELHDIGVAAAVGTELRNVAVRVVSVRTRAVNTASLLLASGAQGSVFLSPGPGLQDILGSAAWIVGEYSSFLLDHHQTLNTLLLLLHHVLNPLVICAYLQTIPKILASIFVSETIAWNSQCQTTTSLLIARVIHFLEPLTTNSDLEVQERSVEILELMRLSAEAVARHDLQNSFGPLILSRVLPALFDGLEMKPVALSAQGKVPLPESIDLAIPLNNSLCGLLREAEQDSFQQQGTAEIEELYYKQSAAITPEIVAETPPDVDLRTLNHRIEPYFDADENPPDKRDERRGRNMNDPFYISAYQANSNADTPFRDILQTTNGHELDIEAIPIMALDLRHKNDHTIDSVDEGAHLKYKQRQRAQVTAEETLDANIPELDRQATDSGTVSRLGRDKNHRGLLQFDSSGIVNLTLDLEGRSDLQNEGDMVKALAEIEELRMEMRRASERVRISDGIPVDGTLIKKKKKKTQDKHLEDSIVSQRNIQNDDTTSKRKKRKKTRQLGTRKYEIKE